MERGGGVGSGDRPGGENTHMKNTCMQINTCITQTHEKARVNTCIRGGSAADAHHKQLLLKQQQQQHHSAESHANNIKANGVFKTSQPLKVSERLLLSPLCRPLRSFVVFVLRGTTCLNDGSMKAATKSQPVCHESVKEVIHERWPVALGSDSLIETCLATTANFITWCRRTLSGS